MVVDAEQKRSEISWGRVAVVVVLTVVIAAAVMLLGNTVSPERTYNDATVVVDGQTFDAVACESEANGIEARYGAEGTAAYVRHMASGESVVVLHTDLGELTSRSVTQLEAPASDQFAFAAEFDDGPPITVTYDYYEMGSCR